MKHSNAKMFVTFITIAFGFYLLLSLVVALIGDMPYREVLTSQGQIVAFIFCYWWTPIFTMVDMSKQNDIAKTKTCKS